MIQHACSSSQPSLSSIPLEHFLPHIPLVSCSRDMALQGPIRGFCEDMTLGLLIGRSIFSKYNFYVLHLSNESFPKNVSDLEGVKNDWFSPMYPDFNVWKKVGNSGSTVSSCTQQQLPTFFQTLKSAYSREILAVLTTSRSLTFLGNGSFER